MNDAQKKDWKKVLRFFWDDVEKLLSMIHNIRFDLL